MALNTNHSPDVSINSFCVRIFEGIRNARPLYTVHVILEKQEGGMYIMYEQGIGTEKETLLLKLRDVSNIPVLCHSGKQETLEATGRDDEHVGYMLVT